MAEGDLASIATHFGTLTDPRVNRTKAHGLLDILTIAICAVVAGAEGPTGMETFGQEREGWLRTFLDLPNGIPSHDTFSRVLARLDPTELQRCFLAWFAAIQTATKGEFVALDGKTLRGSAARSWGEAAVQVVSAWASTNRLVLGQERVDPASNEIPAIPALLVKLHLAGCIVTVDALHCQVTTASTIRDRQADYVLTVKDNQPNLRAAIAEAFAAAQAGTGAAIHATHQTEETNRNRWERRTVWTITDPTVLAQLNPDGVWRDLTSIGMLRSERRLNGATTIDQRLFISSLDGNAQTLLAAIRSHWEIENCVHWTLDVVFREDDSRVAVGHGPTNLAVLRHIALNLLQRVRPLYPKRSLKQQRFAASLNTATLGQILVGPPPAATGSFDESCIHQ